MADRDLNALFLHALKDTYFAENAILRALGKNVGLAQSPALKEAFEAHRGETVSQIERLEQIFGLLSTKPDGVECKAILGILAEGDDVAKEFAGGPAADAGLIASAQAVEHYEITRYGTLLAWSRQLGMTEAEELIKISLAEEESTDELLSELAEEFINPDAVTEPVEVNAG